MSTNIDIKGLNKGQLLDALVLGTRYNGPFAFASEFASYLSPEDSNKSEKIANAGYIDRYGGKPIKTNLSGDFVDPRLYDRDAGQGTFAKIVQIMRLAETKK
uniref:Uncharacterized protein n=1 Tax=viral metagenome TaxID=1070528 RepID=A0A6C0HHD1_9ZZZZ